MIELNSSRPSPAEQAARRNLKKKATRATLELTIRSKTLEVKVLRAQQYALRVRLRWIYGVGGLMIGAAVALGAVASLLPG